MKSYAYPILCAAFVTMLVPTHARAADPFMDARVAASEGKHAKCAKLADEARKRDGATWHSHHLHASCTVLGAQSRKDHMTPVEYEAQIMHAVELLENLVAGPLVPMDKHRAQLGYMATEMRKQLVIDLAEMRARPQ